VNKPVTVQSGRKIGRPLKMLIPMIQSELQQGNAAGQEHYRVAGEMLIEAKDQVSYGQWGRWLTKNFDMTNRTAQQYMRWAREHQLRSGASQYRSLREMTGQSAREREDRQSPQQQRFKRVLRDVTRDREDFMQERQRQDEETSVHRKLANELIDAGYHSLAKLLHPDRGGSKDAMSRLNRVRDELKAIAQTRRFV
jgi:Protein of unknown function (DUF3102)